MLVAEGEGWAFNHDLYRALLQEPDGGPPREGIQRFLINGKIDQYPAHQNQRYELLQWVANQAFTAGESISEKDVNERLKDHSSDYVPLRRYLVDAELVERTRTGAEYSLVVDEGGRKGS